MKASTFYTGAAWFFAAVMILSSIGFVGGLFLLGLKAVTSVVTVSWQTLWVLVVLSGIIRVGIGMIAEATL